MYVNRILSTPYETADFRNVSKSNEVLSLSETPLGRPDLLLSCKGCSYKSKWQNLQKVNKRLKKKVTSLKDSIKELAIVSEPILGAYVVLQNFLG